jgi:hypothetical protein
LKSRFRGFTAKAEKFFTAEGAESFEWSGHELHEFARMLWLSNPDRFLKPVRINKYNRSSAVFSLNQCYIFES